MRTSWALWAFGLCMLMTGCQLAKNVVRNLTNETKLATEECDEHCRYYKLAQTHWDLVGKADPHYPGSMDYADGFKEGFTDYLEFGGSGQPPYLPPRRYWGASFRTPEGSRAIEEWFAGFRHGVRVAQETGYRQWVTMPSASGQNSLADHPLAPSDPGKTIAPQRSLPDASNRLPPLTALPLLETQPAPIQDMPGQMAKTPATRAVSLEFSAHPDPIQENATAGRRPNGIDKAGAGKVSLLPPTVISNDNDMPSERARKSPRPSLLPPRDVVSESGAPEKLSLERGRPVFGPLRPNQSGQLLVFPAAPASPTSGVKGWISKD